MESDDWKWMRRAVDLEKKCNSEAGKVGPKVGAVAVRDNHVLGEAFRGQFIPGDHAEYCLLEHVLAGQDLTGATVYTTLEPCSRRNHPKVPCAERLARAGVKEVVIGLYDPNPKIYREGWRILRDAGVKLRDFPAELRNEIRADNMDFLQQFQACRGNTGSACFDYKQNAGRFTLIDSGGAEITTGWTHRGHGSIHAIDNANHVAKARYAKAFREIDDPGALDFSSYTVDASTGEIVVFRDQKGRYVLIKISEVFAGPERGDDHYELSFEYEFRGSPS
jgi:diaminohydroxyphosphoribosylaminopyrimidine deaminase/5-amino-6-(5-phosphoribosylamino)uracil reductase